MPQETNLNSQPYFDDFDKDKNYQRVLFKPGYPVQARELNNLQSIIKDQVEKFGTHFFKEGSKVIPGNWTYNPNFYAVEINEVFSGVPVSLYLDKLIGLTISGTNSKVRAKVVKVINSNESERGSITLYVGYLDSSSTDTSRREFQDNEVLVAESLIEYGNTFISEGEGFAFTLPSNSTSVGSAFAISNGVYFIRGNFVSVQDEILILNQYDNKPSYRIGFLVNEEIVTYYQDKDLVDNSSGFSNYSAPGADRFKISVSLHKKDLDDFDDSNFIQLITIQDGVIKDTSNINTDYNYFAEELARRTFDESGNYYVNPFYTYCKESLNNEIGNNGIFKDNELTNGGSVPSKDLAIYKISPGKAYIRGYEVETYNPVFLDVPKPRTSKTLESQAVNFNFAPTFSLNNVYGSPLVGINTSSIISFRDKRVGSNAGIATGTEIGIARCYDFVLEQGGYDSDNLKTNRWDLSVFDIQTYSVLTLNQPVTLTTPTYVRGSSTGATGYLKSNVSNSNTITLYEIKGQFSEKEGIVIEDSDENRTSRYINSIKNYNLSDVKSVYSISYGRVFTADTIQETVYSFNTKAGITSVSSGISTVSIGGDNISGIITTGNLIRYNQPGISTISYARVESVDEQQRKFTISAVENVNGVVYGALPVQDLSNIDISTLTVKLPKVGNSSNSASPYSLYSVLPKNNIKSVDLSGADLTIRKQYDNISIANSSTGPISVSYQNSTFLPFDEERYILIKSDGSLQKLTSDKFNFSNGSTILTINNLEDDSNSTLIATLRKKDITQKNKKKKIVESVIINKSTNQGSGTGSNTVNDGLVYGNYPYGTRVQDKEICLNYPDGIILYGIFESNDTSEANSPSVTITSIDGATSTTNDFVIGETFVGKSSGARGFYVQRINDNSLYFIYENDIDFISGEVVSFKNSKVNGIISSVTNNSKNITKNYKFNNGQNEIFYDYSRIIRDSNSTEPTRQLKVYFSRGYYDSSDSGDITTASSYDSHDFIADIQVISKNRATDIIDFRPRVENYTIAEDSSSPFEFNGRKFVDSIHSSTDIISSNESLVMNYSYYLPRIDRIYVTKDRTFSVVFGNPEDVPSLPDEVNGAMNIANVHLPAYLYNVSDARIEFVQNKRYQMKDIFNLENRIKNIEEYTSLSLLEKSTESLFVDDGSGNNRFKSGFIVDNFTTHLNQKIIGFKNSIDDKRKHLRPAHFSTNVPLEISSSDASTVDKGFSSVNGNGISRNKNNITLSYTDRQWLNQQFATRTENVTPFFVKLWEGSLKLYPTADVWIATDRMEANNIDLEGSFNAFADALRTEVTTNEDGKRVGVSPIIWGPYEITGVDLNQRQEVNSSTSVGTQSGTRAGSLDEFRNSAPGRAQFTEVPPNFAITTEETVSTTVTTTNTFLDINLSRQRSGIQNTVTERIDTASLGDRIAKRDVITYLRNRNIEFTSRRMKPYTEVYPFFDGVNVSDYCFSKLIEIEMVSNTGKFEVGEDVIGIFEKEDSKNSSSKITFRLAKSNHKYGPYNNPTDTFDRNPYDREQIIPQEYSDSSTLLNIDTYSLSSDNSGNYNGVLKTGMILTGKNSKAQAIVKNIRLITDRIGTIIGSFYVPSGENGSPRFETGRGRLRLTSSSVNSEIPGVVTTISEETFYSQGDLDTKQETTLSIRNASVEVDDSFRETGTPLFDTQQTGSSTSVSSNVIGSRDTGYRDPLAQSFMVDDKTGVYLTKVGLFFRTKAKTEPVTIQIREIGAEGSPNKKIINGSEVELTPDKVKISEDASEETIFEFDYPIFLEGEKEYAIIIISTVDEYNIWISRFGEFDVATLSNERNRVLVSTQNTLGSLFKSQNASTWEPSSYEDLTFKLYRAEFGSSGFFEIYNSTLPENLESLSKDPIIVESNKVRVSLSGTITNSDLEFGNTIVQSQVGFATAIGNLVGYAGSISELTINQSGIGYTGSSYTYNSVSLRSVTGSGSNATADIIVNNGGATSATIVSGGSGYVVGDVLEPVSIGLGDDNLGLGMKISVSKVSGNNELIIDNVQGEYSTVSTDKIKFINNSGVTTDFTNNGTELSIENVTTLSDGEHFKVIHLNHGMHSSSNSVVLRDISSDVEKTTLTAKYPNDSGLDTVINLFDATNYSTFEGIAVSPSNPGYIKISNEILRYTGISENTLTGVTRQIDNTIGTTYNIEIPVEKYELAGVSLRRINKIHNLSNVSQSIKNPIGSDYFYVKVDMSDNGVDRSVNTGNGKLKFLKQTKVGGSNGKSTYNVPFEIAIPNISNITPSGTTIKSTIRTVSGTSIGGSEVSFVDQGYKDVSNNSYVYFDSPRVIASKINEENNLFDIPNNKSVSLNVYLSTNDSRISPVIDLSKMSLTTISNKINNPILDYTKDPSVNSLFDDPNLFTYVTKQIKLENAATTIKVILDAYIHNDADIRALYSIGEDASNFILFPGYSNINPDNGSIINLENSDGTPDTKPAKLDIYTSNPSYSDFREYEFTANLNTIFNKFSIKLVGTSKTQSFVPIIKNLRIIALA
jgi:hypothetical protein